MRLALLSSPWPSAAEASSSFLRTASMPPLISFSAAPLRFEVPSEDSVEVVLSAGARIAGRIIGLEEREIPLLTLLASGPAGVSREATIDSAAHYVLQGMPPGAWSLRASVLGRSRIAEASIVIESDAADARLDVTFEPGLTLGGVIAIGGSPIAAATVTLLTGNSVPAGIDRTDQDGRFELNGLERGSYIVTVSSFEADLEWSQPCTLTAEREDLQLDITVSRLVGKTVDSSSGLPLGGSFVVLQAMDLQQSISLRPLSANSDSEGGFSFLRVPVGEYSVVAARDGFEPAQTNLSVRPGPLTEIAVPMTPIKAQTP